MTSAPPAFPIAIDEGFEADLRRMQSSAGLSQDRLAPLARLHRSEISLLGNPRSGAFFVDDELAL